MVLPLLYENAGKTLVAPSATWLCVLLETSVTSAVTLALALRWFGVWLNR